MAERDRIRDAILERGWSESKQAYAQSFDSDDLDAAALLDGDLRVPPGDRPAHALDDRGGRARAHRGRHGPALPQPRRGSTPTASPARRDVRGLHRSGWSPRWPRPARSSARRRSSSSSSATPTTSACWARRSTPPPASSSATSRRPTATSASSPRRTRSTRREQRSRHDRGGGGGGRPRGPGLRGRRGRAVLHDRARARPVVAIKRLLASRPGEVSRAARRRQRRQRHGARPRRPPRRLRAGHPLDAGAHQPRRPRHRRGRDPRRRVGRAAAQLAQRRGRRRATARSGSPTRLRAPAGLPARARSSATHVYRHDPAPASRRWSPTAFDKPNGLALLARRARRSTSATPAQPGARSCDLDGVRRRRRRARSPAAASSPVTTRATPTGSRSTPTGASTPRPCRPACRSSTPTASCSARSPLPGAVNFAFGGAGPHPLHHHRHRRLGRRHPRPRKERLNGHATRPHPQVIDDAGADAVIARRRGGRRRARAPRRDRGRRPVRRARRAAPHATARRSRARASPSTRRAPRRSSCGPSREMEEQVIGGRLGALALHGASA